MTETTVDTEKRQVHNVRWLPFTFATLTAPLVTSLPAYALVHISEAVGHSSLGLFFVLTIFIGAPIFGSIPYLLVGAPCLYLALRKNGLKANTAAYALFAHFVAIPLVLIIFLSLDTRGEALGTTAFYGILGCVFCPALGLALQETLCGIAIQKGRVTCVTNIPNGRLPAFAGTTFSR